HIWVIYWMHLNQGWNPLVIPPRGPKTKRGVLATRAPHRPNSIGLSVVRLLKVEGRELTIAAHDMLDGTPVLDIKPYLPYADALPEATHGWLDEVELIPAADPSAVS
ncbi:MAG TPA: tRNA (N6-threonylcarbamoyladenosine(37)-N6)-methyltransferase TrmO, partial [Mariprofundaceae bacterium]|nr:tRNA (N6-threonylcarbamoyladenosine(37)-N6)-methyltransferase TrmO [Mariprofundaceae bacterium]